MLCYSGGWHTHGTKSWPLLWMTHLVMMLMMMVVKMMMMVVVVVMLIVAVTQATPPCVWSQGLKG